MKKEYLLFILFLNLFEGGHFLLVNELDSKFINSLFNKSSNGIRVVSLGSSNPSISSGSNDITISLPAYFEEQCALECLKNILCIQYSFAEAKQTCVVYLRPNFKRQTSYDPIKNSKVSESIGCNVQTCSDAFYCSSASSGKCLCDSDLNIGSTCSSKVTYEASEWSSWSSCSATCDDGFKVRTKRCLKKYDNIVEEVTGMDWLCNSANNEMTQFDVCSVQRCGTYSDWSSWTTCSKICGGSRSRERSCKQNLDSPLCDPIYLKETQYCTSFDDCRATILKLVRTDVNPTANVTKRGYLRFVNTLTNRETRIFVQSNNQIGKIGEIVCSEFGFDKHINTNSILVEDLSNKLSETDYLNYVNSLSINGITCPDQVSSLKECQASSNAKLDTKLYELEVECSFNGYWSSWSSWTQCSVTCGAGAKTRVRSCSSPPQSISETGRGNGTSCGDSNTDFTNCVMPRCKV